MSQSIPNLRSFVESRLAQEEVQRESEGGKRIQFQKQSGKIMKNDTHYKKNLYSAMTTRVLKQQ